MSVEMRLLQIQMLEIQLAGMMRRRGLTRSEEKTMKKIQIEQAKLRLKNIKDTKQETVIMYDSYEEKKQFIKEFLAGVEEESYQLNYNYTKQLADLNALITREQNLLKTRKKEWEITNLNIATEGKDLYTKLLEIAADPTLKTAWESQFDISIEPIIEAALARIKAAMAGVGSTKISKTTPISSIVKTPISNFISDISDIREGKNVSPRRSRLPQFSRGIEHVPQTMIATVHRGESIVPAGKDAGGDNINVSISVTANVDTDYDVERLAAKLGESIQTQLANRTGKSKYRMM